METRPFASSLLVNCETKRSIDATHRNAAHKRSDPTISPQAPPSRSIADSTARSPRDRTRAGWIFVRPNTWDNME